MPRLPGLVGGQLHPFIEAEKAVVVVAVSDCLYKGTSSSLL